MEIDEFDDDIVIVKDGIPNNPSEDPLNVDNIYFPSYAKAIKKINEIINIDSSDDDTCINVDNANNVSTNEIVATRDILSNIFTNGNNKSATIPNVQHEFLNSYSKASRNVVEIDTVEDIELDIPLRTYVIYKEPIKNGTNPNNNPSLPYVKPLGQTKSISETTNSHPRGTQQNKICLEQRTSKKVNKKPTNSQQNKMSHDQRTLEISHDSTYLNKGELNPEQRINFICKRCSFCISDFTLFQSHPCTKLSSRDVMQKPRRKLRRKPNTVTLMENDEADHSKNKIKTFDCEFCIFTTKRFNELFSHLVNYHFPPKKEYLCKICNFFLESYADSERHILEVHGAFTKRNNILATKYRCFHCGLRAQLNSLGKHCRNHVQEYLNSVGLKNDNEPLYECLICNLRTSQIVVWRYHVCKSGKDKKTVENVEEKKIEYFEKNNKHREKMKIHGKRIKEKEMLMCNFCNKEITHESIKCDSSECENVYHLKCVEMYSNFLDPEEVNTLDCWFCTDCNNHAKLDNVMEYFVTMIDDVKNINSCLSFVDEQYLKEVHKRKQMNKILRKMKEDTLKMKKEFSQIHNFIKGAKSEKISNKVAISVCNIIGNFINIDE